jgi:addiction module HigA family antidote
MIRSLASKHLKALWETGRSRIDARMHPRILRRLDVLDAATVPEDMNLPGFDFHALRGHVPTRYTVHVNGPWCITFEFSNGDAHVLDFGQYHQEHRMTRTPDRCPTHPGEVLREDVIPATGKPKAEIARMLGISRQHLHDILATRKPVSAEVAVRLAKLFGTEPLVWIMMQGAYDAWHAEREADVSGVPTLGAVG